MDFIKTELQDNNNSFDLSCVEVKLEDIKNELPNKSDVCPVELGYYSASDALMDCFHSMVLFYDQHGLFGYGTNHLSPPIFNYENFNQAAVRALTQANLDCIRSGYNHFDYHPVTHESLRDKIKYTLSVVNHFVKTVRSSYPNTALLLNQCYGNLQSSLRRFLRVNETIIAGIPDEMSNPVPIYADSPVRGMMQLYFSTYHNALYR